MTLDQAAWLAIGLNAATLVWTVAIFRAGGVSRQTGGRLLVAGAAWLVVLTALFSNGEPFPEDISSTAFYIVILVGVALVGLAMFTPPLLRSSLLGMNQEHLLAPQGIRVFFGATFLLWAGEDVLPRGFGIVDGFTHIGAGFLGLAAAVGVARDRSFRRGLWIANLFGLVDILVVATSIAYVLLSDIGPHHPMMYAVFGPAPVWLWLHLVSIRGLVSTAETAPVVRPAIRS